MDVEWSERQLRERLEEHAGRTLSDAEWETFKQIQLQLAREAAAGRRGILARAGDLLGGVGQLLAVLLVTFLIGAVTYALVVGLTWAYVPHKLETVGWDGTELSAGSFLGGAWTAGLIIFFIWGSQAPRTTAVVWGLSMLGGVIALAIGAILRVA